MSDVKRYGFRKDPMADCYCDMEETDRGGYVTEEDYKSLRSRLAEREAELADESKLRDAASVSIADLVHELAALRSRLAEADALLRAIRGETIDAWDAEMIWLPRIDAHLGRKP